MRDEAALADPARSAHAPAMVTTVVPHDPGWKDAFYKEKSSISGAFAPWPVKLHHIGSTAIPGILAKPIIDVLGEVDELAVADSQAGALQELGYEAMGDYGIEGRRYFRKCDDAGRRTHHLHLFEEGSAHIERQIAFRDYLVAHAEIASEYSSLKASLTSGHTPTSESYPDGKAPFVNRVELEAIQWFRRTRGF